MIKIAKIVFVIFLRNSLNLIKRKPDRCVDGHSGKSETKNEIRHLQIQLTKPAWR